MFNNQTKITFKEAKKKLMAMNLINNFLWNSATEDEEDAKTIASIILSNVLNAKVEVMDVTIQKEFSGLDTIYHGIRMDAHIDRTRINNKATATLYDIEVEDREADRKAIPKRLRFYSSIPDSKHLSSGEDYRLLSDFVSIIILSYDPFLLGDMYYEVKMHLSTHPGYDYDDGRTFILLYANGKPNFDDPDYGKKLQEMLKYIVSGEYSETNYDLTILDNIVSKIKSRPEVTVNLMKQWDREMIMKREITEETQQEYAIKQIIFNRKHKIPDSETRQEFIDNYDFDEDKINALFTEASKRLNP
ncbi:MAG: hypothetical protein K6G84_12395 [Lachnospiraceae bacterium]|nr:hypothetical protein [Lachnospiraceae bacterium]